MQKSKEEVINIEDYSEEKYLKKNLLGCDCSSNIGKKNIDTHTDILFANISYLQGGEVWLG
jgi:hypothetical protein